MHITISEENRIIFEELVEEVNQIKQKAFELSISLLIQLKTVMFQFLLSYKEYSLTNIREYGLAEILMSRANRFFKLDQEDKEPKKQKEKSKFRYKIKAKTPGVKAINSTKINSNTRTQYKSKVKTKRGHKFIIKRMFKIILFPFYILILILGILLESNNSDKLNKNVKNKFTPY